MAWFSPDTKDYLKTIGKDLWYYSSLSFSIALSIVIGLGIGFWIDKSYGTPPVWTLIGLFLGVCAGMSNIYHAYKKALRMK